MWRLLLSKGFTNLIGWSSKELDLCDRNSTVEAVLGAKPEIVIMAAAKVGVRGATNECTVEILTGKSRIQANGMEAAKKAKGDSR